MNTIHFDRLDEALMGRAFARMRARVRDWPNHLYHYTNEEGVRGILSSHRIWAFSAGSQKDKEEISHGCALLADLIDKKTTLRPVSAFTGQILSDLRSLPKERSHNIFLASFCEKDDDRKLFNEFGPYSLHFEIKPPTRPFISAPQGLSKGLSTGQGFKTELVPAIYDPTEKIDWLNCLLDSLVETLRDPSLIQQSGASPWTAASARFVAVTISDQALSLIARFKKEGFREEAEWRIVARPDHTHFSSDVAEADRNCQCYIRTRSSRRYVQLSAAKPESHLIPGTAFGLPTPSLRLPIDAIRVGPFNNADEMTTLARQLLDEHLEAARVLRSKFSSASGQPAAKRILDGTCH